MVRAGGCIVRLLQGIVVHRMVGANCTNCSQMRINSGQFGAISEFFSEAQSARKPLENTVFYADLIAPALDIVGHDQDDVWFWCGECRIQKN